MSSVISPTPSVSTTVNAMPTGAGTASTMILLCSCHLPLTSVLSACRLSKRVTNDLAGIPSAASRSMTSIRPRRFCAPLGAAEPRFLRWPTEETDLLCGHLPPSSVCDNSFSCGLRHVFLTLPRLNPWPLIRWRPPHTHVERATSARRRRLANRHSIGRIRKRVLR